MRLRAAVLLLPVVLFACRSSVSYLVTDTPLPSPGAGLCVAIDTADPAGIWWWEPGARVCADRSTGPDVFRGEQGRVGAEQADGSRIVSFRVNLIPTGALDVRMTLQRDGTLLLEDGQRVPTSVRPDLSIPEFQTGGLDEASY